MLTKIKENINSQYHKMEKKMDEFWIEKTRAEIDFVLLDRITRDIKQMAEAANSMVHTMQMEKLAHDEKAHEYKENQRRESVIEPEPKEEESA